MAEFVLLTTGGWYYPSFDKQGPAELLSNHEIKIVCLHTSCSCLASSLYLFDALPREIWSH